MRARKFLKILSGQLTMELLKIMPRLGTSYSFPGPGTLPTWKFLPQNTIKCPFRVYSGELPKLTTKEEFRGDFCKCLLFFPGRGVYLSQFFGILFFGLALLTGKTRHDRIFTAKRAQAKWNIFDQGIAVVKSVLFVMDFSVDRAETRWEHHGGIPNSKPTTMSQGNGQHSVVWRCD